MKRRISYLVLQIFSFIHFPSVYCSFLQFNLSFWNSSDIIFLSPKGQEPLTKILPILDQEVNQLSIIYSVEQLELIFRQGIRDQFFVVISYKTVEESLTTISQVGKLERTRKKDTIVVMLWPDQIHSVEIAEEIIQSEDFVVSVKGFRMDFGIFVKFGIFSNDTTMYITYHIYTINNIVVHIQVQDVLSCGICSTRIELINGNGQVITAEEPQRFKDGELSFFQTFQRKLTSILEHWNFTIAWKFADVDDSQEPKNGILNGSVLYDIQTGKADIGLEPRHMIPRGAVNISYLPPITDDYISVFFKQPEANAIRDIFAEPFQKPLWVVAFLTWLLLAISMKTCAVIRKRCGATDLDGEVDLSGDTFLLMLATVTQQSWDEHPKAVSLRTIFIFASITGVICYAGYSAAIVSALSTESYLIRTPSALLHSDLRIGARKDFAVNDSTDLGTDVLARIFHRLSTRDNERMVNTTHGYHLIHEAPYAYLTTSIKMYEVIRKWVDDSEICTVTELGMLRQRVHVAMAMRKESYLTEFVRRILILIRERGIRWRLRQNLLYVRRCMETSDSSGKPLGPHDVFNAFMLLCAGYVLSLIFLCLEKIIYCKTNLYMK